MRQIKTKRGRLAKLRSNESVQHFPLRFNAMVDEVNRLAAITKRLLRVVAK